MAFVAWRTWVAGAALTAAQLQQDIRDNLNAWFPLAATSGTAWTTYTPTLTQSVNISKTVTYAKYTQVGKTVIFEVHLVASSSGTANNPVAVGLPVTAATTALIIGSGKINDASAGLNYPGAVYVSSTTTVGLVDTTVASAVLSGQTGATFSVAMVSTDSIDISGVYEAA